MLKLIVSIQNGWGFKPYPSSVWTDIQQMLAQNEEIGIWNGYFRDAPAKWVEGKCSLKIKVKKRWKLIPGQISFRGDGFDDHGDLYRWVFIPNKARVFSRYVSCTHPNWQFERYTHHLPEDPPGVYLKCMHEGCRGTRRYSD